MGAANEWRWRCCNKYIQSVHLCGQGCRFPGPCPSAALRGAAYKLVISQQAAILPQQLLAAHLHRRDVLFAELAGREHAGDGGVHNGGLLGRAAGEGVVQPLAQLRRGRRRW